MSIGIHLTYDKSSYTESESIWFKTSINEIVDSGRQ